MIETTVEKANRSRLAYRRDIDGLRCIAVISVLLFHLDLPWITGGFVGVDVFFVISGFLITRLIRQEILETATFSFSQFYLRRARRLLPAFFTVLFATIIGSIFILPPDSIARLGKAAASASLSISNIFFWIESGYFDTQAQLKPLLHTWTLAVEEQFYMIWPLLLFLSMRKDISKTPLIILVALGVISLIGVEALIKTSPEAVFYLLPFRLCEFALGAGLVWFMKEGLDNKTIHSGLCLSGFIMILWAIFMFTEETRFPGLSAMLPCLGTALIIYSGDKTPLSRPLKWEPVVGLGLISYSLYLIHWPVIVLYKYFIARPLALQDVLLLSMTSIIMAALLYKFIEIPLRHKDGPLGRRSGQSITAIFAIMMTSFIAFGFIAQKDGLMEWRSPSVQMLAFKTASAKAKKRAASNIEKAINREAKETHPHPIAVIGDSYGGDIFAGLSRSLPEHKFEYMIENGCRPYLRFHEEKASSKKKAQCKEYVNSTYKTLAKRTDIQTVIIVSIWQNTAFDYIQPSINALNAIDKRVIIIGPRYEFNTDHNLIVNRAASFYEHLLRVTASLNINETAQHYEQLEALTQATLIDLRPYQCPKKQCTNRLDGTASPFIYDTGHLSVEGGIAIVQNIIREYPALFAKP